MAKKSTDKAATKGKAEAHEPGFDVADAEAVVGAHAEEAQRVGRLIASNEELRQQVAGLKDALDKAKKATNAKVAKIEALERKLADLGVAL